MSIGPKRRSDAITFCGRNALPITVGSDKTQSFVKRVLRYLFVFDDVISQDQAFRCEQWLLESGLEERSYVGKCLKMPQEMGAGYAWFLPDGGARSSSEPPADCAIHDIIEVPSPPASFSGSLIALLKIAFDKDSNLTMLFPEAQKLIASSYLNQRNGLPNDYEVLIMLESVFQANEVTEYTDAHAMAYFIDLTERISRLSREREYLQFANNAQTVSGLIILKRIWMMSVELWLASREKKVSVSEEMLGQVFSHFIETVKRSLFEADLTVFRVAAMLMLDILQTTIGAVILFKAAEDILAQADEKLKAAKSQQDIEAFYDELFLAYPYFFAARVCFRFVCDRGPKEARDAAKAKGNAAEEKFVRISDSLLNALYDLYGDRFAQYGHGILLADCEDDRKTEIFDIFDNQLLYPRSYKAKIGGRI
jgi:hypothetical protein